MERETHDEATMTGFGFSLIVWNDILADFKSAQTRRRGPEFELSQSVSDNESSGNESIAVTCSKEAGFVIDRLKAIEFAIGQEKELHFFEDCVVGK